MFISETLYCPSCFTSCHYRFLVPPNPELDLIVPSPLVPLDPSPLSQLLELPAPPNMLDLGRASYAGLKRALCISGGAVYLFLRLLAIVAPPAPAAKPDQNPGRQASDACASEKDDKSGFSSPLVYGGGGRRGPGPPLSGPPLPKPPNHGRGGRGPAPPVPPCPGWRGMLRVKYL